VPGRAMKYHRLPTALMTEESVNRGFIRSGPHRRLAYHQAEVRDLEVDHEH
jgi:hypothetical protein